MRAEAFRCLRDNAGYLQDPLPNDRDEAIRELIATFESDMHGFIHGGHGTIGEEEARTLLCFGERMAIYAVRTMSPDRVRDGLWAAVLAAGAEDRREVLIVLGVLFDAASRSGGDPVALFADIAKEASSDGASLLQGFLRRDDLDHILENMGFRAAITNSGAFIYERARRPVPPELVAEVLKKFSRRQ